MSPVLRSVGFTSVCAASAAQTLPEPVAILQHCALSSGTGAAVDTFLDQAIVTAAPAAGQVQFTGVGTAPLTALTFNAALTANDQLVGTYVPPSAFPRAS